MSVVVPVIGLFVSLLVAAGVSLHATRTGASRRTALLWGGGVGTVSLGGFLVAAAFAELIHRLYFHQLKPTPVAGSPFEAVAVLVAVGTGISAFGLLPYGIAHQFGSLGTDEPPRR